MTDSLPDLKLGLAGRRILVTGAAGGIGQAVAARFVSAGASVCLSDVDQARLSAVAAELSREGRQPLALTADLSDPEACERLVTDAAQKLGGLDVLINAGAIILRQPLDAVTPADFRKLVDINMAAPFFLARAASVLMRRQGFGRIVLFSSQGAHTGGYVGSTVYAMTKAGVIALVKSLARELAPDGITVNAVAPGLVETPMIRNDVLPEALDAFVRMIPTGRIASPEEMANCCLFLASDWASYVTGLTLDANGGQLMR